ncbi:MAG: T9SS C-terminal target domain-containing protein [Winogradskyella sp.]|uniref:aryl-sulfate sulfotransferase n=1 Tax=Winogradskyella sp. TaxID=1883156 RepID=UPI000F3CE64E|nr:aryl-sulfate sulfotransferase [Winogradskyella sp.]RNC83500.1 MAG: T9SS C-terminal target domain-containing protein [Winogradskyella sp.]
MRIRLLYFLLSFPIFIISQNTLGTVTIDENVTEGYTLFTINTGTYLIDNCGQLINSWTSTFTPGNAVYLLEDGSILRAGRTNTTNIVLGGQGGVIEKFDWEGNLTWQYFYDSATERQHHDIYPMPNGNVLILAATIMTEAEAIQAGRDPLNLSSPNLYNEQIVEVTPVGASSANIVWEWNIKDHLIQDFDATKDNFGVVSENPNLLDINYTSSGSDSSNWLHINSIQYDETLDQIVISSRNVSEIYIIDHSTTTAEAATGSGGTYGKGGDILYRWGNPEAYGRGTTADRQLFGQHFPHFIRNSVSDNGKIIVFNNGNGRTPSFSEVYVLNPPIDSPGVYTQNATLAYGPSTPDYTYTDPVPGDFYSAIISGAQRLPNGNTLIMEGTKGRIFEINPSNTVLWEYFIPIDGTNGNSVDQGVLPTSFNNNSFRATKYSTSYSAFDGRDLTPSAPLENNPDIGSCLSVLSDDTFEITSVVISPNPTRDFININTTQTINKIEFYDINGQKVSEHFDTYRLNISAFNTGIYFAKIYSEGKVISKKFIKQ